MATGTVYSSWSSSYTPSGASSSRKVRTYYTWTTTETATAVKIAVKAYIQLSGGACSVDSGTITLSATGQTTATATKGFSYDGGDGATLINVINKTYTYSKTTSAQTKTIKCSYKVPSSSLWAGTYTATKTFTIPALAAVTITFNANNGSGTVPSAISTYYGVANTIPSNSLTRTGYTFGGWNTASDGSGTAYATGATIKPTANITLYAQWVTTYVKPTIESLVAFRVAATNGSTPTVTSTGTMGFCRFNLTGGNYASYTASVKFGEETAKSMSQSGTTAYGYSSGTISQTSMYTVTVTVVVTGADGIGRTYTESTYISKSVPVFDISSDGNCAAFFGNATDNLTASKLILNGTLEATGDMSVAGDVNVLGELQRQGFSYPLPYWGRIRGSGEQNPSTSYNYFSPSYNGGTAPDHAEVGFEYGRGSVTIASGRTQTTSYFIVPKGVSWVEVTAFFAVANSASEVRRYDVYVCTTKDLATAPSSGNWLAGSIVTPSTTTRTLVTGSQIIPVEEGDYIYFRGYKGTASAVQTVSINGMNIKALA